MPAVITAERAAETTKTADADQFPEVRSGACRSHPTWPWLVLDADGGVYDRKLGRYREQSTGGHGYKTVGVEGQPRYVHRLMVEAWHGVDAWDTYGPVTRHKNADKAFNFILNLNVGTDRDNMDDLMRHRGNLSPDHCGRGHLKKGANLVPSETKRGKSKCRSCDNARSRAKNWRKAGRTVTEEMIQRWADEYLLRHTADTLGTLAFAVTATATAPHLMATA